MVVRSADPGQWVLYSLSGFTRHCTLPTNRVRDRPLNAHERLLVFETAPSTPALLDHPETTDPFEHLPAHVSLRQPALCSVVYDLRPPSLCQSFRHSGWATDRLRVFHALQCTSQSASRLQSFADCGDRAYVYHSLDDPDVYRVAGSACHDRFCGPCTRERGQAIAANVTERLAGQRARFVTLTLKTDGLDLAAGILKLQRAFRRLLRSDFWLARVTGGAAFIETKRSSDNVRWHPHIHAIVQGKYLPHDLLKALWLRITGDSSIIRVQAVTDEASVVRYVTTYAAKCLRTADFPADADLREAVRALHGARLVRTFGSWRGASLTDTPVAGTWEIVAPLADLLALAVAGDYDARAILSSLSSTQARTFLIDHPPRPPPPFSPPEAAPPLQLTFELTPSPLF